MSRDRSSPRPDGDDGLGEHARLAVIAAVSRNGVIGHDGQLAWHLPEDLRHFRRTTMGCPILMGRKTFESIGRPLPGRRNVVVTRNVHWTAPGVEEAPSFEAALDLLKHATKVYVIGGAQLYAQALPVADELVLTEIDQDIDGNVRFPDWDRSAFVEAARETHLSAEGWPYHFVTYQRRPAPAEPPAAGLPA